MSKSLRIMIDQGAFVSAAACVLMPTATAFSADAGLVRQQLLGFKDAYERSFALSGERMQANEALRLLGEEEDLLMVSVVEAKRLLSCLPDFLTYPDISADPEGIVALDWMSSKNAVVSVSAVGIGRLAVAWLKGSNHGYSTIRFDGHNFPVMLISHIREVVRV